MNDAELIKHLGGPTRVAEILAFKKGGAQRVQNWLVRGIPSHIRVKYPQIFMSANLPHPPHTEQSPPVA